MDSEIRYFDFHKTVQNKSQSNLADHEVKPSITPSLLYQ